MSAIKAAVKAVDWEREGKDLAAYEAWFNDTFMAGSSANGAASAHVGVPSEPLTAELKPETSAVDKDVDPVDATIGLLFERYDLDMSGSIDTREARASLRQCTL